MRSSQSRALAELVALAELIGAPVYAELIANTASFPSSHPLFRGAMARSQTAMRKIFDQHDVLFSVGADLFALSLPSDTCAGLARPADRSISTPTRGSWARTIRPRSRSSATRRARCPN